MVLEAGSALVTGASRGIGLEFVRQLANLKKPAKYVFATYRTEDMLLDLEEVQKSSPVTKVILIQMEVRSDEDLEAAKKVVEEVTAGEGLNLIINNAGVAERATFFELTDENLLHHFTNNTLGPIKVFKAFLPLLQQAAAAKPDEGMSVSKAAVINISSKGGSLGGLPEELWTPSLTSYRISKAALNMAMRAIAFQVRDQGILVANYCPGKTKTPLSEFKGTFTAEETISALLKAFSLLNDSSTGLFFDRDAEVIPF